MYRILATLCVVATLIALAGCGGPGPAANNTTTDGIGLTPTDTPGIGPDTPTAEPTSPVPTDESTPTPTAEAMTETPAGTETPTG